MKNPFAGVSEAEARGYLVGATTFIGSEVAALVPDWSHATTVIVQGGGIVIGAAFVLGNAIHALVSDHKQIAPDAKLLATAEADRLRAQLTAVGLKPVA